MSDVPPSSAAAEAPTTEPAPVFRKTKQGNWAVMGPVTTLQRALAGDGKVKVLKKSGDWSEFTVVSLGRPFDVDGVAMCYGYDAADTGPSGDAGPSANTGASANAAGNSTGRPGRADAEPRPPRAFTPPPRDETEPLPVYQGEGEDEWQGEY